MTKNRISALCAIALMFGLFAAPAPALAHDRWERHWGHHDHFGEGFGLGAAIVGGTALAIAAPFIASSEYREPAPRYVEREVIYAPPPVVYAPPPVYYQAPPVYYAPPPPAYYYPPAPAYYGAPPCHRY